ncbi:MAG: ribosome biogenesis factor YjgA [Candidatus Dechloromonas phosphoritropha]
MNGTSGRESRYHSSPMPPTFAMHDEDFSDSNERPSKTREKKAMHELQDLGTELVGLSAGQLKRIKLPDNIHEAVRAAQKITAHGAHKRQLQYLGKLMRSTDDEPIRAGLALIRGESSAETARLHRLERLRTRLLEDESAVADIATTWPGADIQQLRQLRRNALKEQEANKPPKSFRAIFQILQELDLQEASNAAE